MRTRSDVNNGTSPRAWGEGKSPRGIRRGSRNIPTGVGRRFPCASVAKRRTEHPHGRGEKAVLGEQPPGEAGTSPRAWGEGGHGRRKVMVVRNIPTGVGRSTWFLQHRRIRTEHPHGRGEKPM